MFFADDLLSFGEASLDQMNAFRKALDVFCLSSREVVSIEKTKVCISKNVPLIVAT